MKKIVSSTLLALLVMGISILAFTVQPVKADYTWNGTIYIHGDGSIEPADAPLSTVDNVIYTLTDNIGNAAPSSDDTAIIIERDNIILNGAGHTLQGTDASSSIGIHLSGRSNVTVENLNMRNFNVGLALAGSSNNTIAGNLLLSNTYGVNLDDSSNLNTVAGNFLTDNTGGGVSLIGGSNLNTVAGNTMINSGFAAVGLVDSSNNTIADNTVFNSGSGVLLALSSNNTVAGNTVINCAAGVSLILGSNLNTIAGNTLTYNMMMGVALSEGSSLNTVAGNTVTFNLAGVVLQNSSGNTLYHNNFVYNTYQVIDLAWGDPEVPPSVNVWDAGYPSGGNYWSDYEYRYPEATEIDDSGIWNTPYGIDADNQDHYPLMEPWSPTPPTPPIPTTIAELRTEIEELASEGQIDNQGVVRGLLAKLKVAQRLVDKGKLDEARSILEEDFIPQVQSLSGISMTVEAADRLIESAEYIIAHL